MFFAFWENAPIKTTLLPMIKGGAESAKKTRKPNRLKTSGLAGEGGGELRWAV